MDLDQIKTKDCFNVPDDYFDELPKQVMNKIAKQKKVVFWHRTIIAISSVAASLLLIVGIVNLRPKGGEVMTAQVEDSVAQEATVETILTAEVKPESDVVVNNEEQIASSTAVSSHNSKKTVKSSPKRQCEELEDADYQVIDMYREEIEMNEYFLSLY